MEKDEVDFQLDLQTIFLVEDFQSLLQEDQLNLLYQIQNRNQSEKFQYLNLKVQFFHHCLLLNLRVRYMLKFELILVPSLFLVCYVQQNNWIIRNLYGNPKFFFWRTSHSYFNKFFRSVFIIESYYSITIRICI